MMLRFGKPVAEPTSDARFRRGRHGASRLLHRNSLPVGPSYVLTLIVWARDCAFRHMSTVYVRGYMATQSHSVEFAGGNLGGQHHICAFFNSLAGEHRVLRAVIKKGPDRAQKAS